MSINPVSTNPAFADITPAQISAMKFNMAHELHGIVDLALKGELDLTEKQFRNIMMDTSRRVNHRCSSTRDPEQIKEIDEAYSLFQKVMHGSYKK
jgi:hypothetical protein